jgi:small-conductance mechanosensitive channel
MSRLGQVVPVSALGVFLCLTAPAQTPPASFPVVVQGHTLFTVQTSLGPFTAQERAAAASARLSRVAQDLTVSLDKLSAVASDTSTNITVGDRVLLTVTDADAKAAGKSRADLVAADIASIRSEIAVVRGEFTSRSLWWGVLYTLLITAALIGLLRGLKKLKLTLVSRLKRANFRAIRIQQVELISDRQIGNGLIKTVAGIRWFLILALFYFYVPLVLSFFPWTRQYAPRWLDYILGPLGSAGNVVVGYLPSLFVVIITCIGSYLAIQISNFIFRELGSGNITWSGFYPEWADPTHKIVRFLILAATAVIVFPYLPGSRSPAFQGISIFLGVLFSLGSTSAVANIIAGVILTYTRAFQVGDRVKIADTTGDVTEKTLLATRIRTIKNEFITVPNSMVLGSHIINFSTAGEGVSLILHTSVSIGYDAPWRVVHDLLIAAALRTPLVLKEPAPFVLQTSLDDFYVTYEINAHTNEPARMAVTYAELHRNIQDCFNEAGVEIMSPHYEGLRDGNTIAIPEQYLPKGYAAPRFRFEEGHDSRKAAE